MDPLNDGFSQDYKTFTGTVDELEKGLANIACKAFDDALSFEHACKVSMLSRIT
ncbi:unnamed protein product [Protopolystoma xenopodis]|uniref:Uncharacterized protein n=1 Tax=Protopolystoma xenopodis TaxID=117903 RepID=A0A3S5ALW1_9PLAT|nr:unnamed protein product [Protopolystoma xenopodis]